jgi:cytoskeleton protein RodZ
MADPVGGSTAGGRDEGVSGVAAPTAGALLRRAREAQGMHIAVLAAALKVPQRKLEALERDRLDELPDATFARALAQTVCRALKIDATEILALLPKAAGAAGLEQVSGGLNTPFRDKPGPTDHVPTQWLGNPAVLVVVVLLVGAVVLWFWPPAREVLPTPGPAATTTEPGPTSTDAQPGPTTTEVLPAPVLPAPDAASEPAASTVVPAPASSAAPTAPASAPVAQPAAAPAPATAVPTLALRTSAESWVEVVDAGGRTLISRLVPAGESLALEGDPPLRLVVGNVAGTELRFRGEPVVLAPPGGGNVARIELR